MGIGETVTCPICKKRELTDMDGLFECFNCGAYETVQISKTYPDGRIWTHSPVSIGRLKVVCNGKA